MQPKCGCDGNKSDLSVLFFLDIWVSELLESGEAQEPSTPTATGLVLPGEDELSFASA